MMMPRYTRRGWLWGALVAGMLWSPGFAQQPSNTKLAIQHAGFTSPQRRGAPVVIDAKINAPNGLRRAMVFCRSAGEGTFTGLPMEDIGKGVYRAVVPDWMAAGSGLEYYITATDEEGQSTSQGFVGFPLFVPLVAAKASSQEERLRALQETLEALRKSKEKTTGPGSLGDTPLGSR